MADLNEAVERGVRNAFEKPNKYLGGRSMNQVLIGFAQGEIVPVVHGRWVISPGCLWPIGDCSVCGEQHIGTNAAKYCPRCGAKMDLEV